MMASGFSRWRALVYGINVGMIMAVCLDLTEPLAYLLAGMGALLAVRKRWWLSALCFALAALAKEVTLLLATGYILHLLAAIPAGADCFGHCSPSCHLQPGSSSSACGWANGALGQVGRFLRRSS